MDQIQSETIVDTTVAVLANRHGAQRKRDDANEESYEDHFLGQLLWQFHGRSPYKPEAFRTSGMSPFWKSNHEIDGRHTGKMHAAVVVLYRGFFTRRDRLSDWRNRIWSAHRVRCHVSRQLTIHAQERSGFDASLRKPQRISSIGEVPLSNWSDISRSMLRPDSHFRGSNESPA